RKVEQGSPDGGGTQWREAQQPINRTASSPALGIQSVHNSGNISVVLRQSLVQMETPDWLKGRVLAVQSIFISCSNQLGAVESGWTAAWFGAVFSVVGGGIVTILVVATFATGSAALRRWRQ
ncbi:MAG: hypothetical protein ABSB35_41060, partial [Bryobacteraceae bacterium]